jgi:pilus assembly protein CpaC
LEEKSMNAVLNWVKARKVPLALCLVAFAAGFLVAAHARAAETKTISLPVHGGRLIKLSGAATNVFVADPQVADVQVPSSSSIYVLGKKAGHTNVYALDKSGDPILAADVRVNYDVGAIKSLITSELPNNKVKVRSVPSGIVLSGEVADSQDADHAVQLAQSFLGENDKVINQMSVAAPNQVNLRVRVAEMSREVAKQLGINWKSTFTDGNFTLGLFTNQLGTLTNPDSIISHYVKGNFDVMNLIDALSTEGIITTLAEPNLTAVSGQTASFLAGGEFPIPIAQTGTSGTGTALTVQFKKFGVGLDFTPTILNANRISLKVRPEVSQLSTAYSIKTNNITIPGISVRRAETTVELASGQSFAIAGLLDNRTTSQLSKLPGAGDIPILGPLFKSTEFHRNADELIIIVTPYIVKPISLAASKIPTPVDQYKPASDLGRILGNNLGKVQKPEGSKGALGANGTKLQGNPGFYY